MTNYELKDAVKSSQEVREDLSSDVELVVETGSVSACFVFFPAYRKMKSLVNVDRTVFSLQLGRVNDALNV